MQILIRWLHHKSVDLNLYSFQKQEYMCIIELLAHCKVITLIIFISGRGSAISSAKEGKSCSIYYYMVMSLK